MVTANTVRGDHADHIHANCRCEFAIRFSSDMDVAGYDPDKLLEKYDSAEGKTPEEKINSMRREHAHLRTGNDMTAEEIANYKRELNYARKLPEIRLQKKEYALVVHELNNNMTKEDRKHAIVTKPVGNYIYTIVNRGFDEYTFVGKELIR